MEGETNSARKIQLHPFDPAKGVRTRAEYNARYRAKQAAIAMAQQALAQAVESGDAEAIKAAEAELRERTLKPPPDGFVPPKKRKGPEPVRGCPPRGERSPEFWVWSNMRARCNNSKDPAFHNYGGRGIKVCPEWQESFTAFMRDMGPRPSPDHSLDRYPDNNGDYRPGNTRWATRNEQQANRRNSRLHEFEGEMLTVADIARRLGMRKTTIQARINRGQPREEWFAPAGKYERRS